MQFLSKDEAIQMAIRLAGPGAATKFEPKPDAKVSAESSFSLEDEVGRYFYLANVIRNWLSPTLGVLYLATEYGIWPSRENLPLWHRFRSSLGEFRPVHEAPGCMFDPGEMSDLVSFLHLSLVSGWGGFVLSSEGKAVTFSHDDWIAVWGPSADWISQEWGC
jgi:hypothetical protein